MAAATAGVAANMTDPRQARIIELESENARLRARFDRLRNRRSVRVALAVSSLLGWRRKAPAVPVEPPELPTRAIPPRAAGNRIPLDLLEHAPPVSVVIPVYNAPEALERCLRSVVNHTSGASEILLIDDASSDPRVGSLLRSLESRQGIRVMSNESNLGFVATANIGFACTAGDVIMLNSDTEVGPRWVENLRTAAYSAGEVASVTALSNNAGAFSAPDPIGDNEIPMGWTAAEAGRAVARHAGRTYPVTPTANGFCVYLKRAALADVGFFDTDRYPRGYGEENDWSIKGLHRGWVHLVDDATYVLHERSASFGEERGELALRGSARLTEDHPDYQARVNAFLRSPELAAARAQVSVAFAESPPRPRVLAALHDLAGGTPHSTMDLAAALASRFETLVLQSNGRFLTVTDAAGNIVRREELDCPVAIDDAVHAEYTGVVAAILVDLGIELVHVRHLMKHHLELPRVADIVGIPTILSVHDYYLVCPTAHLIDNEGNYCAGVCTPTQGQCPAVPWVMEAPHLKHAWVGVWQSRVEAMMRHVSVVVAASRSAIDVHAGVLPSFASIDTEVIEHGRDLVRHASMARFPEPGQPFRILLAGTIGIHKGGNLVRALSQLDTEGRFEFHVIGTFPGEPVDAGVVVHGRYERGDFPALVHAIEPAVLAILSPTPETWSHTLTEAWSVGLPVIAPDRGAPADRIRRQGGGWLIDVDDAGAAHTSMVGISHDASDHATKVAEAERAAWHSTAEMADAYAALFTRVLEGARTVR